MELRLEHLAPYLPYGLTIETSYQPITVIGLMSIDRELRPQLDCVDESITPTIPIKPILRPLSDLTKEIEFNGNVIEGWEMITLSHQDANRTASHLKSGNFERLAYWKVERLFAHHFDVFGLIDEGLAVDINSLK